MNERYPGKPRILVGSLTRQERGSVASVMRAFVEGLGEKYSFIEHYTDRRYGARSRSRLRPINLWYLCKHLFLWLAKLTLHRPEVAHYPITSYWNIEKSLLFLGCARAFGVRTIGHLHGGAFVESWNSLSRLRRKIALRLLRSLDAFVVLSDGWKTRVCRAGIMPEERVMVVHNPIDPAFESAALRLAIDRDRRRILCLGVMSEAKGVLDLLEAARLFLRPTGYQLDVVGPERQRGIAARCKGTIAQHGLGDIVHIQPGVWGESKLELFEAASVFALPSYYENFPLVVLEAAAAGMAMILTPVGAAPEFFVDRESAWFVPPGQPAALGEAMRGLTRDHELRGKLATAARKVFESRLSRALALNALDRVYQSVLSR